MLISRFDDGTTRAARRHRPGDGGQLRRLRFELGTQRRRRSARQPGGHGGIVWRSQHARRCAMSPASRPRVSCSASRSASISRSAIAPTRSSACSSPTRRSTISSSRTRAPRRSAGSGPRAWHSRRWLTELVFEPYSSKTFTRDLERHAQRRHESAGRATTRRAGVMVFDGLRGQPPGAATTWRRRWSLHRALTIRGLPAPWRAPAPRIDGRTRKSGARREIHRLRLPPSPLAAALALPVGRACGRPRTEDSRFQPSAAQGHGFGGHDARRLPAAHRAQIRRNADADDAGSDRRCQLLERHQVRARPQLHLRRRRRLLQGGHRQRAQAAAAPGLESRWCRSTSASRRKTWMCTSTSRATRSRAWP